MRHSLTTSTMWPEASPICCPFTAFLPNAAPESLSSNSCRSVCAVQTSGFTHFPHRATSLTSWQHTLEEELDNVAWAEVEGWWLKPEVLGWTPGGTTFLSFPLPFQRSTDSSGPDCLWFDDHYQVLGPLGSAVHWTPHAVISLTMRTSQSTSAHSNWTLISSISHSSWIWIFVLA